MSKISSKDIEHVAMLSKLTLTPEEITRFGGQLSSVVDYIHELEEVDTSETIPTSQTTGLKSVYRNDELSTKDTLTQNQAVSGTENIYNGYFKVPGILEERSDK